MYFKLLVNYVTDNKITLLITAQEVAGLNPAEVTKNQLIRGWLFLHKFQITSP